MLFWASIPEVSRRRYSIMAAMAAMMLLAFALYTPSFDNGWVMDDYPVVVDNPDIRSLANFQVNSYPGRPLRELSYLVDHAFFGLDPRGYHIQQNFWHGLNAGLVLLLALTLGCPWVVAACAALLFLVHPLQVEVVANISHRKDSLALAFSLLALLAWLFARKSGGWRWPWLAAAGVFFGIGLLAKENVVVLPGVILAFELARLPSPYRVRVAMTVGIAALVGIAGRIVYLANDADFQLDIGRALLKIGTIQNWTTEGYYLTVFKAWAFMASKFLWPTNLSMEYAFATPSGWFDPWVVAGLLLMLAGLAGACWTFWKSSFTYLPLLWFLLFWLPTSNLLGNYAYFAADRYFYAPLAGLVILAGYGLWLAVGRRAEVFLCAAGALLLVMAWISWQQQNVWRNAESLYRQVLQVNPTSLVGLIGAGEAAEQRGDLDAALRFTEQAGRVSPNDPRVHRLLGRIAMQRGQSARAVGHYQRALALDPTHIMTLLDLGVLYDELEQYDQAIASLQQVIKLNPHSETAYMNLGVVFEHQRRYAEAEAMQRKALAERPDYGKAYYNLGVVLYLENRKPESAAAFAAAAQLMPTDRDVFYNLATVAIEIGDHPLARSVIARLGQFDPVRAEQLKMQLELDGSTRR